MLHLKKTALAVLVLSTGVASAGTMGPVCSAINVTVPCESTAWHVGGQALYLQPTTTANALNYSVSNTSGTFLNTPKSWDWGFQLEAAYHYGTGSDTNLNWYHLNDSTSKTATGPFSYLGADLGTSTSTAIASINPKWDEVNLEFGQHVDVGEAKSIRFHGGVEYARVDNTGSFSIAVPTSAALYYGSQSMAYNGFGPRVGLDFDYNWGNGIGIYAKGATSILAGTSKLSYSKITTLSGVTTSTPVSASAPTIVPELESKLGIKYDYAMAQGDLTLDFGWLWINYFNAEPNKLAANVDVISGDFGLQGLYFGLKWMGNVA